MTALKVGILVLFVIGVVSACNISVTTVSGVEGLGEICAGRLIFEDNFDRIDHSKWRFDNTLAGGGNWEFQWYPGHDQKNAFIRHGVLHLAPTTTASVFGDHFLTSGHVRIPPNQCTQKEWYGCERRGTKDNIINPIRSAKLTTVNSFAFKYGVMEIRAKLPAGDWLWPALWLLPKRWVYGGWPRSGEIDLMESRGNRQLFNGNTNIGAEQISSTLHFGPDWKHNGFMTAHYEKNSRPGYDRNFHNYKLEWTPYHLKFFVDNQHVGTVNAGNGFWERGRFQNSGLPNPWARGSKMAPFDQEFYIIMNLAVGGTNGFFDDKSNNRQGHKPWNNRSPKAAADFWNGRNQWLRGWNLHSDDSHLQVDYVRVWAL